jgi:3-hydroxyacyl-[acyl-carrier-protein] dehydratase
MSTPLTDQQVQEIERNFKRCRPGTADAIVDLRQTGNVELIPNIVPGIVWRYVHENVRPTVEQSNSATELVSLGIDSLTMMEIVLDVQDALDLVIEDADLKEMKTIGDVIAFLQRKYSELHPAS